MIENNIVKSLGAGSGVDSASIVKQLKEIEKAGPQARIDTKKTTAETQISDFGLISGALTTLQTAGEALIDKEGMFSKSASYTASDAFAPVKLETDVLTGTYAFDIQDVAAAQSLSSTLFTATTDAVGEGTLTFEMGEWTSGFAGFTADGTQATKTITIDSTNNTLKGLRDTINKADFGVQASIVKDGTGYRLLFTASSGLQNQLSITVAEAGGSPTNTDASDLSRLAFNTAVGGKKMNGDQLGKDASFTVNGLAITRPTNTIDDVIDGFKFQLSKADPGKIVTVNITDDKSFAEEKVRGFVDAYNKFLETVKPAFSTNEETKKKGSLTNDALGKGIMSQVRNLLGEAITGLDDDGFTALTNVGIRTKLDGTLEIKEKEFTAAFADHFDLVQKLFAPHTESSSSEVTVNSYGKQTEPGDYAVVVTTKPKQGYFTAGAVTAPFSLDTTGKNYTFALKVNGTTSDTISLPDATTYANGGALASAMQNQINKDAKLLAGGITVTVSYDTDHLVFTSTRFGSSSSANVTAASANSIADLGLSVANGTAGVDTAGTINGVTAFGFGNVLRPELDEPGEGLNLIIGANATTATAKYSRGFGSELKTLITQFLSSSGLITNRKADLTQKLKTYESDQKNLDRRIEGFETRLTQQFMAMEGVLNGMNASGNYLDNLFKSLPFTASK